MNLVLLSFLMFLSGFATDFTLVMYVQKVAEYKRLKSLDIKKKKLLRDAAFWSIATGICSILMVEGLTTNLLTTSFWLFGLWLGTYFSDDLETFFKNLLGRLHGKKIF